MWRDVFPKQPQVLVSYWFVWLYQKGVITMDPHGRSHVCHTVDNPRPLQLFNLRGIEQQTPLELLVVLYSCLACECVAVSMPGRANAFAVFHGAYRPVYLMSVAYIHKWTACLEWRISMTRLGDRRRTENRKQPQLLNTLCRPLKLCCWLVGHLWETLLDVVFGRLWWTLV